MAENLADVKIKMKLYLESIKEAREDYRAGRVSTHEEVFGKGLKKQKREERVNGK